MMIIRKACSLLIVLALVASSLIMILSSQAQTIHQPKVPEFTATLGSYNKDYPAVYTVDPYTGENIQKSPAAQMIIKSITVSIENQPFTAYSDSNGNEINLFYEIRVKGHYKDGWLSLEVLKQSDGEFTQSAYTLGGQYGQIEIFRSMTKGEVDFQIRALIGYYTPIDRTSVQIGSEFTGEESNWSTTQTVTVVDSAVTGVTLSPTQPTPSTNTPSNVTQSDSVLQLSLEQGIFAILVGVIMALVVALVLSRRKKA